MDTRNSMILESSGEDSMLIETVKNIVTQGERNESESEEEFFLVSQGEQYPEENVADTASQKHHTEGTLSWMDLCRICANVNDRLIPIFEGEGIEHDLFNKILKYLPIHVSENDTLPLQLCYHCAATLLAWHELSEGCLNAERKLLDMQDTLQNKHEYFNAAPLDNLEISTSGNTATAFNAPNIIDPLPNQQADDKNGTHSTEDISKCNRLRSRITYDRKSILNNSRKMRRITSQIRDNKIDSNRIKMSNASIKSLKEVTSVVNSMPKDKSVEHSSNVNNRSLQIRLPIKSENNENTDKTSKDTMDNSNKSMYTNCMKEVGDVPNIWQKRATELHKSDTSSKKTPKQSKTGKVPSANPVLICKLCNKKFRLQRNYQAHKCMRTEEKLYTCHICGKQFGQAGSLYYHLKHVHAGVKNHTCDICGRSFAMKTAMEDHRRIHTGERPYVCHTCGKTFKAKASLYIHSKIHIDEFPHKCSYCTKGFRWKQQMLGHLTVHTGEKNHRCDICGKGFGVKNDLNRHKHIHSEEKPYTCEQCGLSFGQKRYLKSHERIKHNWESSCLMRDKLKTH